MPLKLGATGITFHDNSVQTTAGGPVVDQYAIGSYVMGRPLNVTSYNNSTIAGSNLYAVGYQAVTASFDNESSILSFKLPNNADGSGNFATSLVNTGSWRCVSIAAAANSNGGAGLWVRYA